MLMYVAPAPICACGGQKTNLQCSLSLSTMDILVIYLQLSLPTSTACYPLSHLIGTKDNILKSSLANTRNQVQVSGFYGLLKFKCCFIPPSSSLKVLTL